MLYQAEPLPDTKGRRIAAEKCAIRCFQYSSKLGSPESLRDPFITIDIAVHRQTCIFMTQDKRPQPNEFGEFAYLCSGCEVWFFSVRPPEKQPNFCVDCAPAKKQVVGEVR